MTEGPAVVKLGGSAAASADLPAWIAAIEAARFPLILVAGGGPFAQTVRALQAPLGYGDAPAHAMALLAMEQFAFAIQGLGRRLDLASTPGEFGSSLSRNRIPLWRPASMVLAEPSIPQSWDVTSDSLAAWLAGRLGAPRLLLVKQAAIPKGGDLDALSAAGLVDPMLCAMLAPGTTLHLCGPEHLGGAAAGFAAGELPGREVLCQSPRAAP